MRAVPFGLLLLVAVAVSAGAAGTSGGSELRYFVALEPGANVESVAADVRASGIDVPRMLPDLQGIEVSLSAGEAPRQLAALREHAGVRYAEAVSGVRVMDLPAEPHFSRQSGYLQAVNAPAAWNIEVGRPEVVVAVVDTGMDVLHPDLQQNVWFNPNEIANNGVDDDSNGCVDDLNGCAFVTDSTIGCPNVTNGFIRDDIGHGTFVAGIIAAPVNGAGIAGVARGVRVMAVKVLDCYGGGDSVAVARGILYAARNGARVINVSLGGLAEASVVNDAVHTAMSAHGAVVVAAAGNSGTTPLAFPARIPAVLSVGATKGGAQGSSRAAFSSYGVGLDVVASGERIVSTVPPARCGLIIACFSDGPYGESAGTSFSAPQVAGLAALMLSLKPSLTAEQVVGIIRSTATPLPPGDAPGWSGAGRVNMLAALQSVQSSVPAGEACVIQSVESGESFTCAGGRRVRMLQIEAPNPGECGGDWARAALGGIFLPPGRTVYLQYDWTRAEADGSALAAPIWRGNDGNDYNLSIVLLYVGLARAAEIGAGNALHLEWARASESWARVLGWNMWAPAKPFTGGGCS
jgi:subtilisin family serine protease